MMRGVKQMWSTAVRAAGATGLYAIVHSVLASLPVKQRVRRRVAARTTDGLYRFAFNGFAVITFAEKDRRVLCLVLRDCNTEARFVATSR